MTRGDSRFILLAIWLILFPFLAWAPPSARAAGLTPEEEFEGGLAFYKKKDFARALESFQKFEKEYPSHPFRPDALFMQGQALRALDQWAEAGQVFSRAAGEHPLLSDYALFHQGEALQKTGERKESLEIFKRFTSLHPQSPRVLQASLKVAELHLQSGEYLQAVEVCESLLKKGLRKDFPARVLFLLGRARESLGEWTEAAKTYRQLWLRYPLHPLSKEAKRIGDSLIREKSLPVGKVPPEALYRRALHFYRAHLHELALREMEGLEGFSAKAYPKSYAGEPWVDELYFHRGMSLFRLKRYPMAAEVFALIVRHSRNEETTEKSFFWLARALFRQDRKEEALKTLSRHQKKYPRGPSMDQALFLRARIHEERKEISRAVAYYRQMAEGFSHSSLRFQAMWQSGWLLFREGKTSEAIQAWDHLQALGPNSPWMEKALYWKGRALKGSGRAPEAEEIFQQLLRNFPNSYYGVLAATPGGILLSGKEPPAILNERSLVPFSALKSQAEGWRNLHLEKGRLLLRLGLPSAAIEELEAAEEEAKTFGETTLEISRLYREAGEYHRSTFLVRKNFTLKPLADFPPEDGLSLYLLAYPLGNGIWVNQYAKEGNVDPALLCGVILEESRFNAQAVSPAGARGLMQVLPSTAKQIVQQMQIQTYSEELLFDPGLNLRLGSFYLARLLEEFGGRPTLALAAYNAGPHMVREWMARAPGSRDDEFVENIPYMETRNYVIRVISSARIYRMLYGGSKDLSSP